MRARIPPPDILNGPRARGRACVPSACPVSLGAVGRPSLSLAPDLVVVPVFSLHVLSSVFFSSLVGSILLLSFLRCLHVARQRFALAQRSFLSV